MGTEPCKSEMPSRLERDLAEYDRIILARGRRAVQGLGAVLGKHPVFRNTDRKVLILSDMDGGGAACTGNIVWRHIGEGEMADILDMYRLYEFSDRLVLFSQEENFGGLLNFVDTGILTMDEAVESLLL